MTKISWTNKTINPFVGCTKISEGCHNCYAITQAMRNESMAEALIENSKNPGRLASYIGLTRPVPDNSRYEWTGKVQFVPSALNEVFSRKKPTTWFVNSMSDLFHQSIHFRDIDQVMAAIAQTPHHTYQVLTKRPEIMLEYFTSHQINLSLPNLWLGVTVENQKECDRRIPYLLKTPAKVRFLSCEPLLEQTVINLEEEKKINWIIIGGESHQSSSKARPFHLEWAQSLIEQCQKAGVKVWFKQAGSNPYYQGKPIKLKSKNGTNLSELPEFCQVQEKPF